jgi:AraC-like DNA-binding protein
VHISLSIKEIGYRLGFKQASHFTKWFTRRVGMTPKTYRERGSKSWVF